MSRRSAQLVGSLGWWSPREGSENPPPMENASPLIVPPGSQLAALVGRLAGAPPGSARSTIWIFPLWLRTVSAGIETSIVCPDENGVPGVTVKPVLGSGLIGRAACTVVPEELMGSAPATPGAMRAATPAKPAIAVAAASATPALRMFMETTPIRGFDLMWSGRCALATRRLAMCAARVQCGMAHMGGQSKAPGDTQKESPCDYPGGLLSRHVIVG